MRPCPVDPLDDMEPTELVLIEFEFVLVMWRGCWWPPLVLEVIVLVAFAGNYWHQAISISQSHLNLENTIKDEMMLELFWGTVGTQISR